MTNDLEHPHALISNMDLFFSEGSAGVFCSCFNLAIFFLLLKMSSVFMSG